MHFSQHPNESKTVAWLRFVRTMWPGNDTGFMDGAEKMLDGADSGNTKQMQCFLFLTTTLL